MQIVIEIPEEMYKDYVLVNLGRGNGKNIVYNLLKAIKKGTPLPKWHGRLIDVDEIPGDSSWDEFADRLDETPTIIEAVRRNNE